MRISPLARAVGLATLGASLTLLVVFIVLTVVFIVTSDPEVRTMTSDFRVFWAAARLFLAGEPLAAFDASRIAGEYGEAADAWMPWLYPPGYLVLVAPFIGLWLKYAQPHLPGTGQGVVLFHLRGRKRIFVYPGDEAHLPERNMEQVVARQTTEELPYRLAFEDDARVMDLEPGQVKLKKGGGHAGHNGLRDIHAQLGSPDYWRLRIGIGHPGVKSEVVHWVLKKPSPDHRIAIEQAIDHSLKALPDLLAGDMTKATKDIHTAP